MKKLTIVATVLTSAISLPTYAAQTSVRDGGVDQELVPCTNIHYAGVYHVSTGVFEPAADTTPQAANPAVIYNNSCMVGGGIIQSALNGSTYIDDGRIPSTTSPAPNTGTLNNYRVNKLQIAYAVRDVTGSAFSIRFRVWDHLLQDASTCTSLASAGNPIVNYNFTGLPGALAPGQLTGYILDVDLIGSEFCIHGDADGTYNADAFGNGFGYGFTLLGQSGTTTATTGGFFVAGLATGSGACPVGEGTYFNNPSVINATGLDDDVTWYRNGQGGQSSGCFTFGGSATGAAGFWLVMRAELDNCAACAGNQCQGGTGTAFCFGYGNPNCPCNNNSANNSGQGCLNSTGLGGQLLGSGAAMVSADSLMINASHLSSGFCAFFQGDAVVQALFLGDGLRCVGGTLVRLGTKPVVSGAATYPQAGDPAISIKGQVPAGGAMRYYAARYRDGAGSPCGTQVNVTSSLNVFWLP